SKVEIFFVRRQDKNGRRTDSILFFLNYYTD
ncbi:MAG: hypothetical protein ACI90V_008849, partial [Bacillariaceae sp.]